MRRARGCGGRFLNTKKTDDDDAAKTETHKGLNPGLPPLMPSAISSNSLISNCSGNADPSRMMQEGKLKSKVSVGRKDGYQEQSGSQFSQNEDYAGKQRAGILVNQPPSRAVATQLVVVLQILSVADPETASPYEVFVYFGYVLSEYDCGTHGIDCSPQVNVSYNQSTTQNKWIHGSASLAADPRRRHGHAYRGILLLRLQRPRLRLLLGDRYPSPADGAHRGRGRRKHHGSSPGTSSVVASLVTGFRGVWGLGGSLGHHGAPAAVAGCPVGDASGAAEEGCHHDKCVCCWHRSPRANQTLVGAPPTTGCDPPCGHLFASFRQIERRESHQKRSIPGVFAQKRTRPDNTSTMESAEEAETKGSASPPPSATTASAAVEVEGDMEERERYSREIKAGLHPLKVPLRSHLSICGPSLSRCRLQSNMSNVSSSGLFSIGMVSRDI
ncbi:hypothetical protein GW17_00015806 [Ensete ventricosum]|nr:hypothetical protein GW17_00015806 [Ensete ventricosum]